MSPAPRTGCRRGCRRRPSGARAPCRTPRRSADQAWRGCAVARRACRCRAGWRRIPPPRRRLATCRYGSPATWRTPGRGARHPRRSASSPRWRVPAPRWSPPGRCQGWPSASASARPAVAAARDPQPGRPPGWQPRGPVAALSGESASSERSRQWPVATPGQGVRNAQNSPAAAAHHRGTSPRRLRHVGVDVTRRRPRRWHPGRTAVADACAPRPGPRLASTGRRDRARPA